MVLFVGDSNVALLDRQVYGLHAHMAKSVSIVAARQELGRLADEVQRTRQPVVLTRRGQPVARIVAEPSIESGRRNKHDAFAELRGTVRLNGDLDELQLAIRELRTEFASNLDRRARVLIPPRKRSRA